MSLTIAGCTWNEYVAKQNIEIDHEDRSTSIFSFIKGYVFRSLKLDLPLLRFG